MPRFAYYLLCLLVALLPLQGSAALLAACPQGSAAIVAAQAAEHEGHCAAEQAAQERSPEASCAGSLACCAAVCMPMALWTGHPEAPATAIPTARELPIHSVVPAMPERPPRANA